MADRARKVRYVHLKVPHRAGHGVHILEELADAEVDLLAFSAFPAGGGKAQIDLITDDVAGVKRVARRNRWRISSVKKGFLVTGDDRIGAVERHLGRLADERINVTAADAVTAGKDRYGMIIWVKPRDYNRAAKALRAR